MSVCCVHMSLMSSLTYFLGDKKHGNQVQGPDSQPCFQPGGPQEPPTQGERHLWTHPAVEDCRHGYGRELLLIYLDTFRCCALQLENVLPDVKKWIVEEEIFFLLCDCSGDGQ